MNSVLLVGLIAFISVAHASASYSFLNLAAAPGPSPSSSSMSRRRIAPAPAAVVPRSSPISRRPPTRASSPSQDRPSAAPKGPKPSRASSKRNPKDQEQQDQDSDDGPEEISPYMQAISAKRRGGGREEGIIAGAVFACIFVVLFLIGGSYIYVTRKHNLERASSCHTHPDSEL